jgi:FixJ family two-component response regulator
MGRNGDLSTSQLISIIDDDACARSATSRLVRSLGWQARTFASCEEFLQSPHLAETCCIVSDVQMPQVSGLELQRRLNALGSRIPIIFMTAFCGNAVEAQAMAGGAIAFLTKPLGPNTLSACIEAALRQRLSPRRA